MARGWPSLHGGAPLVRGWAIDAMCDHLEAVARGEIRRLLINIPPGTTKSMTTNVFFPAWVWGPQDRPQEKFISTSFDRDLTIGHMLRGRDLIDSEWYQTLWGDRFTWSEDQNAKTHYVNSAGGSRFAGSVGSSLIGRRGDFIIVDDPHSTENVESEPIRKQSVRWFAETLPTRVNMQGVSPIIVIMQRVHQGDISGHILSKELGYVHLCLPMEYEPDHPFKSTRFQDPRTQLGELLWPERFPREAIEELKMTFRSFGGPYAEAGQLQQRPSPRGGGMFQEKDFKYLDRAPEHSEIAAVCRGWDLAATESTSASFTAGARVCRLKNGSIVIEDIVRGQWNPHQVYETIRAVGSRDGQPRVKQSIPQDPGQAGKDQIRNIAAALHGYNLHFSPESGSKPARAEMLAAQAQAGNLFLVRGAWNDAFVAEACVFPMGDFLDQVDACSRAYAQIIETKRLPTLGAASRVVR